MSSSLDSWINYRRLSDYRIYTELTCESPMRLRTVTTEVCIWPAMTNALTFAALRMTYFPIHQNNTCTCSI